jgi:hypothetical protein
LSFYSERNPNWQWRLRGWDVHLPGTWRHFSNIVVDIFVGSGFQPGLRLPSLSTWPPPFRRSYLCIGGDPLIFNTTLLPCQTSAKPVTRGTYWFELIVNLDVVRTTIPSLAAEMFFIVISHRDAALQATQKAKYQESKSELSNLIKFNTDSTAAHSTDDLCDGFLQSLFDSSQSRIDPDRWRCSSCVTWFDPRSMLSPVTLVCNQRYPDQIPLFVGLERQWGLQTTFWSKIGKRVFTTKGYRISPFDEMDEGLHTKRRRENAQTSSAIRLKNVDLNLTKC